MKIYKTTWISDEWCGKHIRFGDEPFKEKNKGHVHDASGSGWGQGIRAWGGKDFGSESMFPGKNSEMRRVVFNGKQWNKAPPGKVAKASCWVINPGDPNDPKNPKRDGIPDAIYLGRVGGIKPAWFTCYAYGKVGGGGKKVRNATDEEIEKYIPK